MLQALQSRKRAAALVMIATLTMLLASWVIAQSGEEARAARGDECAELEPQRLLLRLELARGAEEVEYDLTHPECAPEVAAPMVRREWALVPAYGLFVAGMILMLANLRVLGPTRDGRPEGERSWWLWVAAGAALALAAAVAHARKNLLLLRLLTDFGHPSLDLPATLASLRTATTVRWGALAAAAFVAALLWAWRPLRPANLPPAQPYEPLPWAARWGFILSWAAAFLGAAAAGTLACALVQEDPSRAGAALALGGAFLGLFWASAFLRAVGVAGGEPLPRLPVDVLGPEESAEVACEAPAGVVPEGVYPRALWQREWLLTCGRQREAGLKEEGPRVGFGLSGGGIRSATIDLGVFQGIAELDAGAIAASPPERSVLNRIDFISTVSGGGYFGGFLGRLWNRSFVNGPYDVANALRGLGPNGRNILRYLRESRRHLRPSPAVVLRNWATIQLVLVTLLLTVFVSLQVARPWLDALTGRVFALAGGAFWWSPWLFLPVMLFALLVLPLGWAYWMVEPLPFAGALERPAKASRPRVIVWDRSAIAPFAGLALTFVVAVIVAGGVQRTAWRAVWTLVALTAALTFLCRHIAVWIAQRRAGRAARESAGSIGDLENLAAEFRMGKLDTRIHVYSEEQQWLSLWLGRAVTVTAILTVLGLIDSAGQSLYVAFLGPGPSSALSVGGLVSALVAGGALVGKLAAFFAKRTGRPSLPLNLISGTAALLLLAIVLIGVNAVSHAVAWQFGSDSRASGLALTVAATGLVFSVFLGQSLSLLNRSSHQVLYSEGLTRAYLGASNARRWTESVTRVIRGDDCDLMRYWPPPPDKAAPIHLINVTVNETVGGRSQVEEKDRKGNNLALGPFGLSVGVHHHAIVPLGSQDPVGRHVFVYPAEEEAFRVFEYPRAEGTGRRVFTGEMLPLGDWMGISGAAFSTCLGPGMSFWAGVLGISSARGSSSTGAVSGMGAGFNLWQSLLAGLMNARVGRWWDSGVEVCARRGSVRPSFLMRLEHAMARVLPVHAFLLAEFVARFHGTINRHWFLSDGGKFENLGGYELIRRRLPMIVLLDFEEDPDSTLGGLADLIRLARVDFDAEINFLDPEALAEEIDDASREVIGPLEELRRGKWKELAPSEREPWRRWRLTSEDQGGYSRVHAALARITYADEPNRRSRLLYIKATLTGDEPADVLQYHRTHPAFPHETGTDQFLAEVQWESYRKLGEHLARKLFRPPIGTKGWHPRQLA